MFTYFAKFEWEYGQLDLRVEHWKALEKSIFLSWDLEPGLKLRGGPQSWARFRGPLSL